MPVIGNLQKPSIVYNKCVHARQRSAAWDRQRFPAKLEVSWTYRSVAPNLLLAPTKLQQ